MANEEEEKPGLEEFQVLLRKRKADRSDGDDLQTCFKYITYEYKYKYKCSWSKYEYKYEYSPLEYEYKYKYPWLKYEYEYKYL